MSNVGTYTINRTEPVKPPIESVTVTLSVFRVRVIAEALRGMYDSQDTDVKFWNEIEREIKNG